MEILGVYFDPEEREEQMRELIRYDDPEHTPVMFYRSNLWQHSHRVLWHLESILPWVREALPDFDEDVARAIAPIHDDHEPISPKKDVQLRYKEEMTPEEKVELAHEEDQAFRELDKKWGHPRINGYSYLDIWLMAASKSSIEAQVVSYCDKFDGGGEAWHEVFAGNHLFLDPATGTNRHTGGYVKRLNAFLEIYPTLRPLFSMKHPMFNIPGLDGLQVVAQGRPHTRESVLQSTGFVPYDHWKKTIIERGGIDSLVTQVEFL